MRFLVSADETGSIKELYASRGVDTSKKESILPKLLQNFLQPGEHSNVRNRVVHFRQYNHSWLVATRFGGMVSIYDLASETAECLLLHTYALPVDSLDRPISLLTFEEHEFIMVAFESGVLFVIRLDATFLRPPLRLQVCDNSKNTKPLCAFVANPYAAGVFAYGGKETDLKVIRMFLASRKFEDSDFSDAACWKTKVLFAAENVEPDHLGIVCPIDISAILFQKEAPKKGFCLVTATKTGHIHKYNTVEDQVPIGSYKVCENPILTMNFATEAQHQVIVTDKHTFVARLSLVEVNAKGQRIVSASAGTFYRPTLKVLGKYTEGGNTGAIFGVDISLDANIVAFGGLDRYLRVFDITSRKLLCKVYLGTQVSCLEIMDDADDDEANEAREDDEVWNQLGSADEKAVKKPKIEA